MQLWLDCQNAGHRGCVYRNGACICEPCHAKVDELEARYVRGQTMAATPEAQAMSMAEEKERLRWTEALAVFDYHTPDYQEPAAAIQAFANGIAVNLLNGMVDTAGWVVASDFTRKVVDDFTKRVQKERDVLWLKAHGADRTDYACGLSEDDIKGMVKRGCKEYPAADEKKRLKLWLHLVSEHKAMMDPFEPLASLEDMHKHEHTGPGTAVAAASPQRAASVVPSRACRRRVPLVIPWLCFMLGVVIGYTSFVLIHRSRVREILKREEQLTADERRFATTINGLRSRVEQALADDDLVENPRISRHKRSR